MPLASIVIPCYNAAAHLRETLESARAQTLRDLEIICVDNNSTDETPRILDEYAANDARIRIVTESEAGEGPARDAGRRQARGAWLYFLDADDLMEPTLLEHAVERGEDTASDLVIFRTAYLDDQTGEVRPCPECFETDWIGHWREEGVFSPRENPERLFTSFQNWVHNKLYRASFVAEHGLAFQQVHRMADILFTCRALAEANRIALLDETLHRYRTNNRESALYSADAYPLDFYTAFLALRTSLEEAGTWELYHDTFVNWAEEAVAMNVYRSRSPETFRTIVETMQREGLERLDITGFPDDRAIFPLRHTCCQVIGCEDLADVAFYYFKLERDHMVSLETELSRMRVSRPFRVGTALAETYHRVRRAFRRRNT